MPRRAPTLEWGRWLPCGEPTTNQEATLEPRELANSIVDALSDHLGEDILLLDISELTPIADYFVIANGTSERQLRALVEAVQAIKVGRPSRVEGDPASGWVLVDHGSVITHLFSEERRAYFGLEEVWRAARVVARLQ